jgi:hypothetical protein
LEHSLLQKGIAVVARYYAYPPAEKQTKEMKMIAPADHRLICEMRHISKTKCDSRRYYGCPKFR